MNMLLHKIDEYYKRISQYRPYSDQQLLQEIKNFYRIECTWSSNAIEGNTYSLSETKVLLEDGLTARGKPIIDALGIINHAKAFEYIFNLLNDKELTEENVCYIHSLLAGSLENNTNAGAYRTCNVFITDSKYLVAKPEKISSLMKQLFDNQK